MSTPPVPKPATITSANVPKAAAPAAPNPAVSPTASTAPVEQGQLPVYDLPLIRAVPLADPDFADLKPKNPMHILYWANRGYQNGHRVNYRVAQGFRPARKEDIKNLPLDDQGDCYLCDVNGHIVDGDRVLMIIGKNAYQGALLNNHNKAIRRGNKFGQVHQNWREMPDGSLVPVETPMDVVQATIGEVRSSPAQRAKINSFVPAPAELEGMLGSVSKPEKP